jgi:hypothetical protein
MSRSQIQLGESVAIIIIVIILLVIGIAFWNKFNQADTKQVITESQDNAVVELAKTVSDLPDFKCYRTEHVSSVNCFDWYKILALNRSMNYDDSLHPGIRQKTFEYYKNYFGTSRITFEQIYPTDINVTVYDDNITSQRAPKIYIPVVFENNLGNRAFTTFGWIVVEGYIR